MAEAKAASIGMGRANWAPDRPSFRVVAGPKTVGSFVPKLTKAAFERYGFPAAAILTDWEAIAGRELASYTEPERLKWPKQTEVAEEASTVEGIKDAAQPGATLVLRVDGPRAIEIAHRKTQLLERINAYFGFRAVTDLRFVQAPISRAKLKPKAKVIMARGPHAAEKSEPSPRQAIDFGKIANAGLRGALERLGSAVEARSAGKAGAKRLGV